MKQAITIWFGAIVAIIALLKLNIHSLFLRFVITGVVPGTETIIPAKTMLLVYAAVAMAILFSVILRKVDNKPKPPKNVDYRESLLPKRRFSQVS